MVAKQLRTVFHRALPDPRALSAGGATSQIAVVFEVRAVASRYEDDGQPPDGGADSGAALPIRETGAGRPAAPTGARAEVRDREAYYAELRSAVHGQSWSIPLPRAALDDQETDTPKRRPDDESWDDMIARFGDDTGT